MTLIVETGGGVVGAESYAAVASIDAYWLARSHDPVASVWAAGTTAQKEGAAREATGYSDAEFGPYYRGDRAGYIQGLLFPRTTALDDDGYPLPALPTVLINAVCELSGRAISARLAVDAARGSSVKSAKAGPVGVTFDTSLLQTASYGSILGMLSPILNGLQDPGRAIWAWS